MSGSFYVEESGMGESSERPNLVDGDAEGNENKELGVLSKERERENNKRFLVTQRKLKLKTLGD